MKISALKLYRLFLKYCIFSYNFDVNFIYVLSLFYFKNQT
jgi:hypothetical protein